MNTFIRMSHKESYHLEGTIRNGKEVQPSYNQLLAQHTSLLFTVKLWTYRDYLAPSKAMLPDILPILATAGTNFIKYHVNEKELITTDMYLSFNKNLQPIACWELLRYTDRKSLINRSVDSNWPWQPINWILSFMCLGISKEAKWNGFQIIATNKYKLARTWDLNFFMTAQNLIG